MSYLEQSKRFQGRVFWYRRTMRQKATLRRDETQNAIQRVTICKTRDWLLKMPEKEQKKKKKKRQTRPQMLYTIDVLTRRKKEQKRGSTGVHILCTARRMACSSQPHAVCASILATACQGHILISAPHQCRLNWATADYSCGMAKGHSMTGSAGLTREIPLLGL